MNIINTDTYVEIERQGNRYTYAKNSKDLVFLSDRIYIDTPTNRDEIIERLAGVESITSGGAPVAVPASMNALFALLLTYFYA